MTNNQVHPHELTCPYCLKSVDPKTVLFCTVNKGAAKDASYDPQFAEVQKKYLTFSPAPRRSDMQQTNLITMEERPMYLFFPWTEEGCPEHLRHKFSAPNHPPLTADTCIPSKIDVLISNGYTPIQLLASDENSQTDAVPEQVQTAAEEEVEEEEELEEDLFTSKRHSPSQDKQSSAQSNVDTNVRRTLTEIACPHCHGVLPRDFGKLPLYRIVLLGASGCGKTTYMTNVAHLLTKSIGFPGKLVTSVRLSAESKRYFDYLITCQKEARIGATVRVTDGYSEPTVFPIVMTVETELERFILVMNDCPGEAVKDPSFINNYPALSMAHGVIFIIDPLSSIHRQGSNNIKKTIMTILQQEGLAQNEKAINDYHYAKDSFQETIDAFIDLVKDDTTRPPMLQSVVMNLHKLDVLQSTLNGHTVPCIERSDRNDLANQHGDGMNMADIQQTSMQLTSIISNSLDVGSYETSVRDLSEIFGPVYTLCTTTRNRNIQGEFVAPDITSEGNKGRPIADADLKGFRMLEPLLCVLAQLNLLSINENPTVTMDEENTDDEPVGFWRRLFKKSH